MRSNFTGTFEVNGLDTKNPYIREGKTTKGVPYKSFNASIVAEKNNRGYVELFGMKSDVIKTIDNDGNKIEISRADIDDEDVKNSVASYRTHVVNIDGNRVTFIDEWSMIEYLVEHIEDLKGKKVTVTGQVQKNVYNGKITNRFVIQNIYEADEDSKNKLQITAEAFFGKDNIDLDSWGDEKKVCINGYTHEYIDGAQKYVPQQFILDASKIDFNNEKHVKLLGFKLKQFGCELDGSKVKCKLGKNIYSQMFIINYVNGSEQVEFTEDMLTDLQKEKLELGLATLDDFRVGNVYGNRVTLFKIQDTDTKGKYADGLIDTEIKASEFAEDIYVPSKPETEEEAFKGMNKPEPEEEEDDEDLFS